MLYRHLGRTGLLISEVGLGCASFWGKKIFSESDAIRLVHAAADHGVSFFDTGSSYSDGNAEPRLGRALAGLRNKNELIVATKAGTRLDDRGKLYRDWSPASVRQSVEDSLRQLKLDTIPLLQLHGPQIENLTDDLIDTLTRLKQAGKVRHLGINSFEMPVLEHIMTLPVFETVMIDYNILRPERGAIIEKLAAQDLGILAAMALAGGLHGRRRFGNFGLRDLWYAARAWKNHRTDVARSRHFRFLNEQPGWTAGAIALAWVLANPHVGCAVFGTTRLPHLLAAVAASGRSLDTALMARIEQAAAMPA